MQTLCMPRSAWRRQQPEDHIKDTYNNLRSGRAKVELARQMDFGPMNTIFFARKRILSNIEYQALKILAFLTPVVS